MRGTVAKKMRRIAVAAVGMTLMVGTAHAVSVDYTTSHVYKKEDIQCGRGIIGASCIGNPVVAEDGLTYYGIDSVYGWFVKNFDPSALQPKPRDGVFDDGRVADIKDGLGNVIGISVQDNETGNWKTGPIGGEWAKGLGALKSKAATEQYVVMDHLMRDPANPNQLRPGIDFNTRLKDDGKTLYFWGNYNQEPTPVYIYSKMALPDKWKVPGANYKVTSAKLVLDHDITNSPNDQIRPEDFENENATGVLPQYTVCPSAPALAPNACSGLPAGTWVSAVDSQEGGDLELLPAGTVLYGLDPATGLFAKTNAWFTTLDRDPFAGPNPRFRFKSSKFGQDLPGVELPQYVVGTPTTTTVDLLSITDKVTGVKVLADSKNWNNFVDEYTDIFGNYDPLDGYSMEDCQLTQDLDLMLYIKGEVGKPTVVRSAKLLVTYEDPDGVAVPPIDLAVTALTIPTSVYKSTVNTLKVTVDNLQPGAVPATVTLVGKDKLGVTVGNFTSNITTPADNSAVTLSYVWTAPAAGTTITWTATVSNPTDINNINNVKTVSMLVKK